jgi:hypothetical protein
VSNKYKTVAGIPKGRGNFEEPEDNIKITLKGNVCDDVD